MKGGSAMLIATIMSAFSSTPTVEASMLVSKPNAICNRHCDNVASASSVLSSIESRREELTCILKSFREHYYNLCNDVETVDHNEYDQLKNLELFSRGMSEFMKGVLTNEADSIKIEHGEEVYDSFRHLVAIHGQVRKNISNILALYKDEMGEVETIHNTEFEPTEEFIAAAYQVSENLYHTH
ncbi:hypothetical protein KO533_21770 [Shewanella sp. NKUCC05_KAH]|uniref:hypothetical protein n=1 Tax=Shewanella sp. NKUCC05_KAH TaxID=2842126 RepID=UPI001C5AFBF3|nr:hypothetical protein [Shewanella sp. NKUCC05_KAH]MBU1393019.1 hypothetical protein [Gammaproteobacteria bacterium]MBU1476479.1 hypothetical protein [Gammaproteobacteria bacterium]MBU2003060.1 hypothetical protein [Gammaproteobacteria bacterium]MBU2130914.1 hypothetical protein [Gammaproteobacteria bacterium]MBU2186149.1 hypothetical protein [Gammaproteobacteria bacterium]